MSKRILVAFVSVSMVALMTSCATSEQWAEWAKHDSHFASWKHMGFSLSSRGTTPEDKVRKSDIERAKAERWWGEAIVVTPDQIFLD